MFTTFDHTALLIIDMINDFSFSGGERLVSPATVAARHIRALKDQLLPFGVPVIFANDNFGKWRSASNEEIERVGHSPGRAVLDYLTPTPTDYVVLKPRHSVFFATPMDILLKSLHIRRLILTGITTDSCVLFSAYDAYMREYELWIPEDCTAAGTEAARDHALALAGRVLKASTTGSVPDSSLEPELPF